MSPADPPGSFWKEPVDQTLHVIAAWGILVAVTYIPWPWNGILISLGVMVERERIQHDSFPRVGRGSRLDMIVWTLATLVGVWWLAR